MSSYHHLSQQPQQPSPPTAAPPPPRWCEDLWLAMSTLYSLNRQHQNQYRRGGVGGCRFSSQREAHEFLIHIQTRNVRRKVQSLKQSKQQQRNARSATAASASSSSAPPRAVEMGSSWLACLYILCHQQHHTNGNGAQSGDGAAGTHRLFCAQTLLHRLRRTKVNEAVDWEIERPDDLDENGALQLYQSCDYLSTMVPTYQHWIRTTTASWSSDPFVCAVTDQYSYHSGTAASPTASTIHDEERIKGELSLLTLGAIAYSTAASAIREMSSPQSGNNQHHHHPIGVITNPLVSTIGSTMATLALRVRYCQQTPGGSSPAASEPSQLPPPTVVTLITQSLSAVWQAAARDSGDGNAGTDSASRLAFGATLLSCLAATPETLLGGSGGARGRLSMDPKCMQAANQELRTSGLASLLETIQYQRSQYQQSPEEEHWFDLWVLHTLNQWAKNLPLPPEFVPLINRYIASESYHHMQAALSCVIAICEGGAWTAQDVLSYSLGLSDQQLVQQPNKKRQTSKSKKRHKDLLQCSKTDALMEEVHREVHERGQLACNTTHMVWNSLASSLRQALAAANADPAAPVHGEGPIGCLSAAANACLPHLVRQSAHGQEARDMFLEIATAFQEICNSQNKTARALALEPLYTLHSTAVDTIRFRGPLADGFESLLVDHFFQCCMGLASTCGYPAVYFDDLAANSDEDLEIERNDVRDLLRAVAGSGESGSTFSPLSSGAPPIGATLKLLLRLLQACEHSILSSRQHHQLFEETVIHAFSALAKPLNHHARLIRFGEIGDSIQVLLLASRVLQLANEDIITAFSHSFPAVDVLPRSRVANIATASLAPMLAALSERTETHQLIMKCLDVSVQAAATSILNLPELAAQSTLAGHPYDIRGTMRGPGGEDHVGCLTLMRLVFESDDLARLVVHSSTQIIERLCHIHKELKLIEIGRGQGVMHGRGVTPKSRRILLNVLCHIELLAGGQAGASEMLHNLFRSAITTASSFRSHSPLNEQQYYEICEAVFDLGAFSPIIVRSLFKTEVDADNCVEETSCLEVLTNACLQGYERSNNLTETEPDGATTQWNRLRAAVFNLLKSSAYPDISPRAAEIIRTLNIAECEAIHRQCGRGPTSGSSVFHDDIISADSVPAGLFIRIIAEVLEKACRSSVPPEALQQCLATLYASRSFVLSSLLLDCSDPRTGSFVDPRSTLAEAWFFAMVQVAKVASKGASNTTVEEVLTDTVSVIVVLLFYPILGKTLEERATAPGFSFDGPQSLRLTELLAIFFGLGPSLMGKVSGRLVGQIPADFGPDIHLQDPILRGAVIIGAALLRASQGALPPWAVESVPEIYSGLFVALNRDCNTFALVMQSSMNVRLSSTVQASVGSVRPGELLSGPHFATLSDSAKTKFIAEARECSRKENMVSWRRLKVLVKQACGGKKKETDFGQKPSLTSWEFDRL